MRITGETKLFGGIIIATLLIIGIGVAIYSRPAPTYTREELIPAGTTTKGNKDASNYLVEFSDFQCPSCKLFKDAVGELTDKYKDKLFYAFRHYPLQQHQEAQKAAAAVEAAGAQGKFWEMHNWLFDNQDKLTDQAIEEEAGKLGLDQKKFLEDLSSGKFNDKINKDITDGQKLGISATPTFFLNGQKLELFSVDELKKAVEKAIGK